MARARALYDTRFKSLVEPEHRDELIMIDLMSSDYEIGTDEEQFELADRLRRRHTETELCCLRIGVGPIYSIGEIR
jgi:hypothetical protein